MALSAEPRYRLLPLITALFVTVLIVSNIIATKPVGIGGLVLPAALILFPIAYILGDVLTEVYGYAQARRVIWIGFLANLIAVVAILAAGALPAASFWDGQEAYGRILGSSARILGASFLAYLVGELLNSYVLARLKVASSGRHLWLRTIASTVVGQAADSAIFITAAFLGLWTPYQILTAIISQWLIKVVYEALFTPATYAVTRTLKRVEGVDHFDRDTSFGLIGRHGRARD